MADMHAGTGAPMGAAAYQVADGNPLTKLTYWAGALLSLALLIAVCIWGYKLVMRDVSGIPVVRAATGEMRVRPADPGGQLAENTGLAVNEVAALGTAAPPADRLVLAPQPPALSVDDVPSALPEALPPVAEVQQDPDSALELSGDESVAALLTALTEGTDVALGEQVREQSGGIRIISAPTSTPIAAPQAAEVAPEPAPSVVSIPGLRVSLRPRVRPAGIGRRTASLRPSLPSGSIDPATLPAGTRLAQLGAYDSPEVARSEWDRFQSRFAGQLAGKDPVIQRAQSGGKTFFRLRAHGFADLAEARGFCAQLKAAGQDCIPVVTR